MDEFHYYGDPDRGWAWQVPLITLTRAQFVLMSATLGDVTAIAEDLTRRTGRETARVTGVDRPVPLHFSYARTPVQETVEELLETRQAPVYIVHFSQAAAMERAQALSSIRVITREQRDEIADAIGGFRFTTGFGKTLSRLVRAGIGVHHAGMLPRYRRLVETLAQRGLLRVICGTDTLGVGINVPIRTVLITALSKFDGQKMRQLIGAGVPPDRGSRGSRRATTPPARSSCSRPSTRSRTRPPSARRATTRRSSRRSCARRRPPARSPGARARSSGSSPPSPNRSRRS